MKQRAGSLRKTTILTNHYPTSSKGREKTCKLTRSEMKREEEQQTPLRKFTQSLGLPTKAYMSQVGKWKRNVLVFR